MKNKVEGNTGRKNNEIKMEKVTKQMQKMLTNYRTELVNELSGKYGFGCEEALAYLASKEPVEEEKRGRPAKKVKTLVTKEQEVDAVIMEMLEDSDPLALAAKQSENVASEKSEGTTGEEKEKKNGRREASKYEEGVRRDVQRE